MTWAQDRLDRVFSREEMLSMGEPYWSILDKYTFRDAEGRHVLCWDHARYVNHSFHANCLPTVDGFELAVRDIEPGEELTDDYGTLNPTEPFLALPEPGSRRRWVRPDDLLRFHEEWDAQLTAAFPAFTEVAQPLAFLLPPDVADRAVAIARGERPMDSIRSTWCGDGVAEAVRRRPSPRPSARSHRAVR
ncbi:MAG: SET domain-containing protein [Thermoanaerobaculia bacterium]